MEKACATCIYLVPYHGKVNKIGGREVSKHWCIQHNGFIKNGLKECPFRKAKKSK